MDEPHCASRQITISDHDEMNVNFTNKPPIAIVSDDSVLWYLTPRYGRSVIHWVTHHIACQVQVQKNALLSIAVPGGLYDPHDIWNGAINAPRIMQNVSNIDFEIEVKFQSQMNKMRRCWV